VTSNIRAMIIAGNVSSEYSKLLGGQVCELIVYLHRNLHHSRIQLLQNRIDRQAQFDAGKLPTFLPETLHVRKREWTVPLGMTYLFVAFLPSP
jgi:malate synthase